MKIHKRIYDRYISQIRINEIVKRINPLLKDSGKILDVGCGNGKISKILMGKNPGLKINGIDVFEIENPKIKVEVFDGEKIPYKENSFDTITLIDVLHHEKDLETLFKEVIRVSNKYIIIKDHYFKNGIDRLIIKLYDYVGNKPYGVKLPYNFKSIKEWKELINKYNLEILHFEKFRYKMQPGKQLIMKLKVKDEK